MEMDHPPTLTHDNKDSMLEILKMSNFDKNSRFTLEYLTNSLALLISKGTSLFPAKKATNPPITKLSPFTLHWDNVFCFVELNFK